MCDRDIKLLLNYQNHLRQQKWIHVLKLSVDLSLTNNTLN